MTSPLLPDSGRTEVDESALSPSTLPTPNRSPIVLVLELVLVLGFLIVAGKKRFTLKENSNEAP